MSENGSLFGKSVDVWGSSERLTLISKVTRHIIDDNPDNVRSRVGGEVAFSPAKI
jgi:hypothetical protein